MNNREKKKEGFKFGRDFNSTKRNPKMSNFISINKSINLRL